MYHQSHFQIDPPPYSPPRVDHAGSSPQYRQMADNPTLADENVRSIYYACEGSHARLGPSLERQIDTNGQNWPKHAQEPDHQLDPLDQELLAEDQVDNKHYNWHAQESEQQEDLALDENLSWIPKGERPEVRSVVQLLVSCKTYYGHRSGKADTS